MMSAPARTRRASPARFARRLTAVMAAATMAVGLLMAGAPHASAKTTGQADCTLVPTPGTIERTALGRAYFVHVPAELSGSSVPLLLGLHGFGQPPFLHELDTGWSKVAASKHFIVAYPLARNLVWDFAQESADVRYLREVVRDISSTWCVNPRHVHAEGHSRGAAMAARLACDESTVFASVTGYAGADPSLIEGRTPCLPDRPIAVGIFHGNEDTIAAFKDAAEHRSQWLARNGCPSTPTTEPNVPVEASRYAPCQAGVEVVWRIYQAKHLWPTGADGTDITNRMWDLFLRNPLPD